MTQLQSNLITLMAMPGLTLAVALLSRWRESRKKETPRLHIAVDMVSTKQNGIFQQRIDLRNDLEKIHKDNLNTYGTNIHKPKDMIYVLSKSVDEAIELLAKHSIQPTNFYLNYDRDNNSNNPKIFINFMFRIEYLFDGRTEFVGYFYSPTKNYNYCKIKLIEEFKKMKVKYPQYNFTTLFRTINVKNKAVL